MLLGPTASGKTDVLDRLYDGSFEVIAADSMQAYRGMDIGTAKPSLAGRARVPHHLVDILNPDEQYTCGEFVRRADCAAREVLARGRLPVVSGGTAYYLRAFLYGLPDSPVGDPAVRERLEAEERERGTAALHEELARLDPPSAAKIHPNDRYRVVRALEIIRITGRPRSDIELPPEPRGDWSFRVVGLAVDRAALGPRIEGRVRDMARQGLAGEVKALLRSGYGPRDPGMRGIGYREILELRRGCSSYEEAFRRIAANTVRFAKRQMTFFRAFPAVRWLEPDSVEEIAAELRAAAEPVGGARCRDEPASSTPPGREGP